MKPQSVPSFTLVQRMGRFPFHFGMDASQKKRRTTSLSGYSIILAFDYIPHVTACQQLFFDL
jgi:hypothetical protein